MKPLTPHWADQTAARVVRFWGKQDQYTVASGITPSGVVHIGNFREVITVAFVAKALQDLGCKVRFIYSWDDFDTFRKVPVNLPQQDMLQKELRRPISRVPDPYGEDESYAAHNIKVFERELTQIGIKPEYLYQHNRYADGVYAQGIRDALAARDKIRAILDEHRTSPLPDDYLPTSIYCEQCDRDQMVYERYVGEWDYSYKCELCGHKATVDIRKTRNLKLNWRTDWPMRWAHEGVHFEPGGKDHSSEGGSYDTAKKIVKAVWNREPPEYLQYDFVSIKGGTGKMSSSAGHLITLSEAYEVYDPQMVRWIFANQRPNHDFAIAFDADVIKVYEEFDRAEQTALDPEADQGSKWPLLRRAYELSVIGPIAKTAPFRPPFRELCNHLQICDGDAQRTKERYYAAVVKSAQEQELFASRCQRAWNWLTRYAPAEFRFIINQKPVDINITPEQKTALAALRQLIAETDLESIDAQELNQQIYDRVIRGTGCDGKDFFPVVYQKLISRDRGPRLPAFLKEIGKTRLLGLI